MLNDRYIRQKLVINDIGQQSLIQSSVLIIGAGGLGCPISLYLVSAGVGHITIIDDDIVSLSNLHRQILFSEADIDIPKVYVAKAKLKAINSTAKIDAIWDRLTLKNAQNLIANHDLVIMGCDNFETRILVSKMCRDNDVKYINASVLGDEGNIAYYDNQHNCYMCNTPSNDDLLQIPDPMSVGVLGPMVGVIGTMAATMAVEVLIGNDAPYYNRIYTFDSRTLKIKDFPLEKSINCTVCY